MYNKYIIRRQPFVAISNNHSVSEADLYEASFNRKTGCDCSQQEEIDKAVKSTFSEKTGINRSLLSRLESLDYTPSVDQLLALSEILGFDYSDFFVDDEVKVKNLWSARRLL